MIELVYHSRARFVFDQGMVDAILDTARSRNSEEHITGVLFFDGESFIQILEGPDEKVENIFALIEADRRHENVQSVYKGKILNRSFADWSMGYKFISPLTDQLHEYDWETHIVETTAGSSNTNPGAQFFQFMKKNFLKEKQDF